MLRSRSTCAASGPTSCIRSEKVIGSSWPSSAFVVGVNIGSGSCSLSCMPFGSRTPLTVPHCWYSAHADPAR